MKLIDKKMVITKDNEGSSLVIALIFFMLCSLVCAGFIYMANSSTVSATKLSSIQYPTPAPIPSPEPTPPLEAGYEEECISVNFVFDALCNDFNQAFEAADKGGQYQIIKRSNPENLTYEVLSYYNYNYGNSNVPITTAEDGSQMATRTYKVTVKNMKPVNVTITMTGMDGSTGNAEVDSSKPKYKGCLYLKSLTITVTSTAAGCSYNRSVTYDFNGETRYIKCIKSNNTALYPKNYYFEVSKEIIWYEV